jgi:D-beta-D-heptose 7-phosphate kinase/D-beta-D-heptose 1-phosphate adenosyltransferase
MVNQNQVKFSMEEAIARRASLASGQIVTLATGVFDILHVEHLRFLKRAKQQGDVLFVGIERDRRVRQLKGKGRPVNSEIHRAQVISELKSVDCVFLLPADMENQAGRERVIQKLKPEIYAVSANTPFLQEKEKIIKKFAGQLRVVHQHNPNISTTKMIAAKRKHRRRGRSSNI